MTVSSELIVWIGTGIMGFLGFNAHLLIRIFSATTKMHTEQAVFQATSAAAASALETKTDSLRRHLERNEQETTQNSAWIQNQKRSNN